MNYCFPKVGVQFNFTPKGLSITSMPTQLPSVATIGNPVAGLMHRGRTPVVEIGRGCCDEGSACFVVTGSRQGFAFTNASSVAINDLLL